jgi:hypothetical protein
MFSSVAISGKRATPDRVYYNGTVINNTLTSTKQSDDPNITFQDQRQTPLVNDAHNYEVAVQNFSLNGCTKTLPLLIPQIGAQVVTQEVSGIEAIVSDSTVRSNTTEPPTFYKQIQYVNVPNSFSVGNTVLQASGFTQTDLNFSTPQKIVACDLNSFTIIYYGNNLPNGTYTNGGFSVSFKYQDPADVTTTIYSISFAVQYNSNYRISTKYIVWRPENQASYTLVPKTALPTQKETDYYYCYTYSHFISLVNIALRAAWVECGGGSTAPFGTQCPFFEFDQETGLFSINQDSNTCMTQYGQILPAPYYAASNPGATNPISRPYIVDEYSFVGMNTCLENLLTNFTSTYFAAGKLWNNQPNKFLPESVIDMGLPFSLLDGTAFSNTPVGVSLRSEPKSSIFQLINPFTGTAQARAFFARLPQDFKSTGGCWSPIASFVLLTNNIPVRNEGTANPVIFGDANIGSVASGGAFQKVLVETPIDAVTSDIWKGWVLFEPKIETYSSLDPSHEGISNIDIELFWRNRLTNSLIPVHVPNQGSMSFRLLFKRK